MVGWLRRLKSWGRGSRGRLGLVCSVALWLRRRARGSRGRRRLSGLAAAVPRSRARGSRGRRGSVCSVVLWLRRRLGPRSAGRHETISAARRGRSPRSSRSAGNLPWSRLLHRRSGQVTGAAMWRHPGPRTADWGGVTIAASSRSICLRQWSSDVDFGLLQLPPRRPPGPPGDPADRSNVRLPLGHRQAPKPQHLVVSCAAQPPYLGHGPTRVEIRRYPVDGLRIPCGRPVDRPARFVHARRRASVPNRAGGHNPRVLRTGVLF